MCVCVCVCACVCSCLAYNIYMYILYTCIYYTFIHTLHKIYIYVCLHGLSLEDAQVVVSSREGEGIEG